MYIYIYMFTAEERYIIIFSKIQLLFKLPSHTFLFLKVMEVFGKFCQEIYKFQSELFIFCTSKLQLLCRLIFTLLLIKQYCIFFFYIFLTSISEFVITKKKKNFWTEVSCKARISQLREDTNLSKQSLNLNLKLPIQSYLIHCINS